ncbi:MAG TPA: hypothetical protein VN870_03555, partial [Streptosporangiaceae bacterium]|nr:hypothetical protein [Streptosporangiaceae bacterium]
RVGEPVGQRGHGVGADPELHAELARRGHPDLRPAHGFALQAIGPSGATATPRGLEALAMSALIFEDIRSRWASALGPGRLSALEADLRAMVPGETFRLDVPGWFGG